MQRRKPPTPAAARVLAEIRRIIKAGQEPTHGELCRRLKRGKNAVSLALRRLEDDGWVHRPKHRPGCARPIRVRK
jgi:Mn-dependent DtxR family transcriptional regulator